MTDLLGARRAGIVAPHGAPSEADPARASAEPVELREVMGGTLRIGAQGRDPVRARPPAGMPMTVPAGPGSRRVVTVLFADLVGSTDLGERLDAEAARSVLRGFYGMARATLEAHGATVEKFIGDAVMAVFGIPRVHEDDPLRAARAAAALRQGIAALSKETVQQHGLPLRLRIGLETGDVMAGSPDADTLVTGDVVNLAARLQGAAAPDEILMGPRCAAILRGRVEAETLEPRVLKGKADPVAPVRLTSVADGPDHRPALGRFVGRERELTILGDAWNAVVERRRPGLVTIVAPPGTGKSRLVAEFIEGIGTPGLVGRCLSYGDGATYWPIAEIVRAAAGITEEDGPQAARARLDALLGNDPDAALVAGRVAAVIGLDVSAGAAEEAPWAVRRLLESVAVKSPLVVLVDDLQWAEPPLLDMLEYVLGWASPVPLLLLCLARPELRDLRPDWGTAIEGAVTLPLTPLSMSATEKLLDDVAGATLPDAVRERIVHAADGNPLFAQELLGLLLDEGHLRRIDGAWQPPGDLDRLPMPSTVSALLSARLDLLAPRERAVLERSSVVGERFEGAAVLAISPTEERPAVTRELLSLVRKELLRPDRSELLGGDGFRFRHLLVRDAAYASLPKADRAAIHGRFAEWLTDVAGDRLPEVEAIVGHHHEQAARYLRELGAPASAVAPVVDRAVAHLASAARRALEPGDAAAAVPLLTRAFGLLAPDDPRRDELGGELAVALMFTGRPAEALTLADDLDHRNGPHRRDTWTRLAAQLTIIRCLSTMAPTDLEAIDRAVDGLEPLDRAWAGHAVAMLWWVSSQIAAAESAVDLAREEARIAGSRRLERMVLFWGATFYGSRPVSAGRIRSERDLAGAGGDRLLRTAALVDLAGLDALQDDIGSARSKLAEVKATYDELGLRLWAAAMVEMEAAIEIVSGAPARILGRVRAGVQDLASMDAGGYLLVATAMLAWTEACAGDHDAASSSLDRYRALSERGGSDVWAAAIAGLAATHLAIAADDLEAAARTIDAVVASLQGTDLWLLSIEARFLQARVHRLRGVPDAAHDAASAALALARAKESPIGVRKAVALLGEDAPSSSG